MARRALRAMIAFTGSLLLAGCQGARPAALGARDGRLAPCPASPNCVSSQAPARGPGVEPLAFAGSAPAAIRRLAGIVRSLPRTTVVTENGTYLHAEVRSAVLRFVDDVEFLADEAAGAIHIRSAARTGYWDLGVNRRRVGEIRARWSRPRP